ncbi:MAG: lysophospholipid acyltransferase family protein [Planctomycetota bacterium]
MGKKLRQARRRIRRLRAESPFKISLPRRRLNAPLRWLVPVLERSAGLHKLADVYHHSVMLSQDEEFWRACLRTMEMTYEIASGDIERIPAEGPVVVVANHPFGGIEGLILADLLRRRRPDSKILASYLLSRVPELHEVFVLVDPFEGDAIGVFPAGTVSHLHLKSREVVDPAWNHSTAWMVRKTQATVVPVYFHGQNSSFFQAAGLIHPLLRTALLPREMLRKRRLCAPVHIGTPLKWEKLQAFDDDQDLIEYLRLRTYLLKSKAQKVGRRAQRKARRVQRKAERGKSAQKPIVDAVDPSILQAEIAALPPENLLGKQGEHAVYFAEGEQAPGVLREIGRLREVSFRDVHEGTGEEIDLDRFDRHYTHLFTWNHETREIIGSYRMGKTDEIIERHGIEGLYTRTLFTYGHDLIHRLGRSIELGRSFVRPEYQKNFGPLMLLWRGIGKYVHQNPEYRTLFGTVSINAEYQNISQQLIAQFLEDQAFDSELARLIQPRSPFKRRNIPGHGKKRQLPEGVRDIRDVSDLIAEIEASQKAVPVLLRQYLNLGGKVIGFNIDASFGHVLDGLIVIDLLKTDPKLLGYFMGDAEVRAFLEGHGVDADPALDGESRGEQVES